TGTTSTASSTPAPAPAIGNPAGGASFSIWQPGVVSPLLPLALGQVPPTGVFTWWGDIAAWSPDGQYLAQRVALRGLLVSDQTALPPPQTLASYGWAHAPRVPVRDAGLQPIEPVARDSSFTFAADNTPGVLVAWRPDGRVVAVDAAIPDHAVLLYNTTSGASLPSLLPATTGGISGVEPAEANVLRWSPDGARLLLLDMTVGTLTIWRPDKLP